MKKNHFDIETNFSVDEVIKKLRQITLNATISSQSNYREKFSWQINENGAKLTPIEDTIRGKTVYELKFINANSKTVIRISNNVFEKRQIVRGILIGFCIPFGVIILILSIIYIENSEFLPVSLCLSLIFILPSLLYKAKPLTNDEYKNDRYIDMITKKLKT